MGKSQLLYKKAKKIIPGGTQLLSKRPELHLPELWPAYYKRAKGCTIWDLDNKKYIDVATMGIGSCILGYADAGINKAVKSVIDNASMTTLNCPEEVELAQLLCMLHPWADMVRYAKTGGESMTVAARIARAKTGKDIVLFCGYHGWHDWYISSNLSNKKSLDGHLLPGLQPSGVPRVLRNTAIPFEYNDISSFMRLLKKHNNKIAAVIMEPLRNYYPKDGFLRKIRRETSKRGIVLVFDEITSGWRLTSGGAHKLLGVNPDIAVFAKGMSNGYPMAAIIGKKQVMKAAQDSFISSTYWTERIGLKAAIETIKKYQKNNVHKHLNKIGKMVQEGWGKAGVRNGLKIHVGGIYPLSHFSFEYKNALELKTLFTQLMLEKGYLASTSFYSSFAHKTNQIEKYLDSVNAVFSVISKALKNKKINKLLKGPVCHSGFKRLN